MGMLLEGSLIEGAFFSGLITIVQFFRDNSEIP